MKLQLRLESDSLLSVNAVNQRYQNYLELGSLVQQCKNIICRNVGFSLVFVRKHVNKVAHLMVKIPGEVNNFVVMSSPPLNLLETILSDALLN